MQSSSCIYSLIGGGERYSTIWQVSSSSSKSFPLFTCKNQKTSILVSLSFESSSRDLDGAKVVFKGYDEKTQKAVELYDKDSAGLSPFELIIFQSGKSKLTEAGSGQDSYKYGGDLECKGNVFKVETYNQDFVSDKQWSKGFEKINLTLGQCDSKNGRQECSIKFGGDVGLSWKDDFQPKVII